MIPIREAVPHLEQRPLLATSCFSRLVAWIEARWFPSRIAARYARKQRALEEILASGMRARSRDELEAVFGPPAYSLNPRDFSLLDRSGRSRKPDHVEVYMVSGCMIDMCFFLQEGTFELMGAPYPTAADIHLALLRPASTNKLVA